MDNPHERLPDAEGQHAHESSDVDIRAIAMFGLGLLVMIVLVSAVVAGLFIYFDFRASLRDPPPVPLAEERKPATGPQLEVLSTEVLRQFRAWEDSRLNAWEWIDRQQGVARIPIDRAIDIVARQGLPKWPRVEPQPSEPGPVLREPQR